MNDLKQAQSSLVTTEFVLLEVADALAAPALRKKTIRFVNGLRDLPALQIVPASQDLMLDAWQLYSQREDKGWGLTDCTSFVVMRQEGIADAFTSDRHFVQAGCSVLLPTRP
jgi:predicted nucleic acid-binding protein